MSSRWIALLSAIALSACSAEISTVELSPRLEAGASVDGLPYRVKESYVIELYKKTDQGYVRVNQDKTTALANPDRLYLLRHDGKAFADAHTKFEINPDGTLKTVHLDSQPGVAKAADTAAQTIDSIQKAQTARDTAEEAARGASETNELTYVKALGAVRVAEAKLASLPAATSAADRAANENAVIEAKINANIAARKAGVERPYPDIGL